MLRVVVENGAGIGRCFVADGCRIFLEFDAWMLGVCVAAHRSLDALYGAVHDHRILQGLACIMGVAHGRGGVVGQMRG